MSSGPGLLTFGFVVLCCFWAWLVGVGSKECAAVGLFVWVSVVVSRVVEGRGLWPARNAARKGPWRLAGPGCRASGIALATPKAPLTWEGRPRRLRGTTTGTHTPEFP